MSLSDRNFCDQKWDEMKPAAGGRFCDSCQKPVFDLRQHSWGAINHFYDQNNDDVCGVFSNDQAKFWGTRSKHFRGKTAVTASLLTLAQLASSDASGQNDSIPEHLMSSPPPCEESAIWENIEEPQKDESNRVVQGSLTNSPAVEKAATTVVSGKVKSGYDWRKLPLHGALVKVKGTNIKTVTDDCGYFEIEIPKEVENVEIVVKFVGFQKEDVALTPEKHEAIVLSPKRYRKKFRWKFWKRKRVIYGVRF